MALIRPGNLLRNIPRGVPRGRFLKTFHREKPYVCICIYDCFEYFLIFISYTRTQHQWRNILNYWKPLQLSQQATRRHFSRMTTVRLSDSTSYIMNKFETCWGGAGGSLYSKVQSEQVWTCPGGKGLCKGCPHGRTDGHDWKHTLGHSVGGRY